MSKNNIAKINMSEFSRPNRTGKDSYAPTTINITSEQRRFIAKYNIVLTSFVQAKLNELMKQIGYVDIETIKNEKGED